jgi:hypothetical protein
MSNRCKGPTGAADALGWDESIGIQHLKRLAFYVIPVRSVPFGTQRGLPRRNRSLCIVLVASYGFEPGENTMSVSVELLAQQVLQLAPAERARLLNQIIGSLDADSERDARWNALAAQRDAQADADPSLLVPGPEALARIRESLG